MTRDSIRILEEVRKLSDSEWETLKAELLKSEQEEEDITRREILEQEKIKNYEKEIYNLLKEIGIEMKHVGYRYIQTAILICIKDPNKLKRVTIELYPTIAEMFQTTPSKVESGIRRTIDKMYDVGNYEKLNRIFGNKISPNKGKPSNSEFIAEIIEYLSYK